ncbi:hypothetical protein SAMN05444274_102141 [Mariniphaga anaerophila]|uniref:Uncharacterized protein n=1 Tax=Mariniphaga anaerophila TaxID=1484053 RepID=A0A1M4VMC7_9BACT|nr:hypothetical protein SAMN05444274_102141 [Mariniphaga anaerophila]
MANTGLINKRQKTFVFSKQGTDYKSAPTGATIRWIKNINSIDSMLIYTINIQKSQLITIFEYAA